MRTRSYGRGGSRGVPDGYDTWYDWALVYRYWHGNNAGLRQPYLLEIQELLRLGADMRAEDLATQLGVSRRTVERWRSQHPGWFDATRSSRQARTWRQANAPTSKRGSEAVLAEDAS